MLSNKLYRLGIGAFRTFPSRVRVELFKISMTRPVVTGAKPVRPADPVYSFATNIQSVFHPALQLVITLYLLLFVAVYDVPSGA